jgi:hypothetical protein
MTKKTPPSIGQFALSERDDLLATIAEQSREIERLNDCWQDCRASKEAFACNAISLQNRLAALKAQPCVGNERGHDTKGSRKALGAINAKLRAKVGMLEREVTRLNASRVPEGWKLVPVEPTLNMLGAALMNQVDCADAIEVIRADYKAMLSAAPAPTVEPDHSDVIVPRELLNLIDEAMCDFLGEDDPLLGDLRALLGGEV